MLMKSSHHMMFKKQMAYLVIIAWGCLISGPVWAAPQGGVVTSGTATINQSGHVTNINQATQKAAINWQSFSTRPQETVNFHQPNAAAIALNRVIGNERSILEGALNATGRVFLINSNGILFAKGSTVNTAGFIASTLNLSDEDFTAGNYAFTKNGPTGSVINMGTITAKEGGYVALLGPAVSNQGVIAATRGSVALASGDKVTLNFNGDSLVNVTVDQGTLNALVENKEAVYADGGKVILTAKAADDLLGAQVNNSGIIQARTINDLKGSITLYAHGGTAAIDGTLDASAPITGDGGFIETSGDRVTIADRANITTASAKGANGIWLIDPDGFAITRTGDMTGNTLTNALKSGNVTITSTSGKGINGNIDIYDPVDWSANTLTLNATNNIYVYREMNATGTASFAASYGHLLDANGNPTTMVSGAGNADGTPYGLYTYAGPPDRDNYRTVFFSRVNFSGSGSVILNGKPYTVINKASDLLNVKDNLDGNYVLGSDIGGLKDSITGMDAFTGNFNGLGHRIRSSGVTATGLFGTIGANATLSNLGIVESWFPAAADPSVAVPAVGMLANVNHGTIINSFIGNDGNYGSLENSNIIVVGGLVGKNSGLIAQCHNYSSYVHAKDIAGGLVGINEASGRIIDSSATRYSGQYNSCIRVSGQNPNGITYVGGLVGKNYGHIERSFASIPLSLTDSNSLSGAFAGLNAGTIDQCYAAAPWAPPHKAPHLAGFVWENTGTITNSYTTALRNAEKWDAGFAYNNSGIIRHAYTTVYSGNTQNSVRYGFIYNNTGTIDDAYWQADTGSGATPVTDTSGATQLDAKQFSTFSNYTGFDTDVWGADGRPSGRPVLRNLPIYVMTRLDRIPTYGDVVPYDAAPNFVFYSLKLLDYGVQGWGDIITIAGSNGYVDAGNRAAADVLASSVYKNFKGVVIILPKSLTIVPSSKLVADKTYDGTIAGTVNDGVTLTYRGGFVGSQTLDIHFNKATFPDKNVGQDKTVTLEYDWTGTNGGKPSNYDFSTTGTASITPRPISTVHVTAGNDKVYDGTTTDTVSYQLPDKAAGDDLVLNYTAAFTDKNVGQDKTVTVIPLSLSGTDASNYTFAATSSLKTTASITPLTLRLFGTKASDDGNTTIPAENISATNLAAGDAVTFGGSVKIAATTTGLQEMTDISGLAIDNPNYTLAGSSGCAIVGNASMMLDKVASGTAVINTVGTTTTITTSDKAVLDWLRFKIGANETVNFVQPAVTSIVLNRVVGGEATVIKGVLNANGRVFIINSNGVLFSAGSSVNTAGLVASALHLDNSDFLANNYVFTASTGNGSVIAEGDIFIVEGGFLALVARQGITNSGVITAHGGDALLISAGQLTLTLNDSGLTGYAIENLNGTTQVGGHVNLGSASGNGGLLETAGKDVKLSGAFALNTGTNGTWSWTQDAITIGVAGSLSGNSVGNNLDLRNLILNAHNSGITVNDAVAWSGDTALTMNAKTGITVNNPIASAGTQASLTLTAASEDVSINAPVTATGSNANMAFNAAGDININNAVVLSGDNAALTMNYGGDYKIRTRATYSGAVLDAKGKPIPKKDTSGGVYGSITLNGEKSTLTINGTPYTLIHSMNHLDLLDKNYGVNGMYYNPRRGAYDAAANASIGNAIRNFTDAGGSETFYNPTTGKKDIPATKKTGDVIYYYNPETKSYDLTVAYTGKIDRYYYNPATEKYDIPNYDPVSAKYYDPSSSLPFTQRYNLTALYTGRKYYYNPSTGKFDKADYDTTSNTYYDPSTGTYHLSDSYSGKDYYYNLSTAKYDKTDYDTTSGKWYDPVTELYAASSNQGSKYFNPTTGYYDRTSPYVVSGYYALAQNLDASGTTYVMSPIGAFSGTLAGLGHTVNSLTMSSLERYSGLIGEMTGGSVIRDIGVVNANVSISPQSHHGSGAWTALAGKISNATVSHAYSTGIVPSAGLIGIADRSIISDSFSDAYISGVGGGLIRIARYSTVMRSHATGDVSSGGGLIERSSATDIAYCYATGNVGSEGAVSLGQGGLVGQYYDATDHFVVNSFATGNVTGIGSIGGLLGQTGGTLTIDNTYATGNVTLTVGGLYGAGIGGLIGNGSGTISNSHATGNVIVYGSNRDHDCFTTGAGGLIGSGGGTLTNVYTTGKVYASGVSYVGGLIGLGGGILTNVHSTGDVVGGRRVGGLIGWGEAAIYDSYASGTVTGTNASAWDLSVGGLLGFGGITEMENTYWNADHTAGGIFSGVGSSTKSQGLTQKQFKDLQYYRDGTIDQVLADRAARQDAFEADAGSVAAGTTGRILQRDTNPSSGAATLGEGQRQPSLDDHIVFADSTDYGAHIRAISADGVYFDLDLGDDSDERKKRKNE